MPGITIQKFCWCQAPMAPTLTQAAVTSKVHVFQEGHKNDEIFTVDLTFTKSRGWAKKGINDDFKSGGNILGQSLSLNH